MRAYLSTTKDLDEYRVACSTMMLRIGVLPVTFQNIGASTLRPVDAACSAISESELFIQILGPSYGGLVQPGGISAVEMEYEVSQKRKIPTFVFFVKEHLQEYSDERKESSDDIKANERFKNQILQRHTVEFVQSPSDCAAKLIATLYTNLLKPDFPVEVPLGQVEFFFEYFRLRPKFLADLLAITESVYELILGISLTKESSYRKDKDSRAVLGASRKEMKTDFRAQLQIDRINTGHSVKFRIATGWKPDISTKDGDLYIHLAKPLVALVTAGIVITGSVASCSLAYTAVEEAIRQPLVTEKLTNEVEQQKLTAEKLILEVEKLRTKIEDAEPDVRKKLDVELRRVQKMTLENPHVDQMKVNLGNIDFGS